VPNPSYETVDPPYTSFRFEVVLTLDAPVPGITDPLCNASFAECEGLEMTIEPKTVRSGGDNRRQIHLIGPVSYSQLTLRRGMTANLQLWNWFAAAAQTGRVSTAQGQITLWDADGTPRLTFVLAECLPVKLRGPSLHAKDGTIAIEEMQLVYTNLAVRPAGDAGGGLGLSASVSAGVGASFSAGASAGFSASASLSAGAGVSISGGPGLSGGVGASAMASLELD
jgi:phage tail-like protein